MRELELREGRGAGGRGAPLRCSWQVANVAVGK